MISELRARLLFERYTEGISSPEEVKEFLELINSGEHHTLVFNLMDEYLVAHEFSGGMDADQKKEVLNHIFTAKEEVPDLPEIQLRKRFSLWKRIGVAASILAFLSVGSYFIRHERTLPSYVIYKGDLSPGGAKATLTLVDGTKLSLTDAANGKLAEQAGVSVKKTADGKLLYEVKDQVSGKISGFNTISTPAGGQYQVVLPDGSKVWLNAESTLKYPVSFAAAAIRKVELKGEAYFEIAKVTDGNGRVPFLVTSKGQEVEVLGTHFNINGYEEEGFTATTLLEGRVKVKRQAAFDQMIMPGEQARVAKGIQVVDVDTSITVAWKNGLFKFENANISTVMSQFSRWYDVDVEYQGKIPANKFNGEIYRNMNASKAFKILSFAGISFRIEAPENHSGRKKVVITQK